MVQAANNIYFGTESDIIDQESLEIVNEYLSYIAITRAPATFNRHQKVLENLLLASGKPLTKLSPEDVYLLIKPDELTPTQLESTLDVLSVFSRFCIDENFIKRPLLKKQWRSRRKKSYPRYLNSLDMAQIQLQAEMLPQRDRTLFEFMSLTGCNPLQTSGLNITDVNLNERTVYIIDNNRRRRIAVITDRCALLMQNCIDNRIDQSNPALFQNNRGRRLTPGGIYKIINNIGKAAGLSISLNSTCLRNTLEHRLMKNGASIELIRSILGQMS